MPNFPERSLVSPFGKLQLNECKSEAKINITIFSANGIPGHTLLLDPNGNNFKFFPLKSHLFVSSELRYLSGLNSKGLSQYRGSLWIDQTFRNTVQPFGMVYPPTVQSLLGDRGTRRGPIGCNRNVSLIVASRY